MTGFGPLPGEETRRREFESPPGYQDIFIESSFRLDVSPMRLLAGVKSVGPIAGRHERRRVGVAERGSLSVSRRAVREKKQTPPGVPGFLLVFRWETYEFVVVRRLASFRIVSRSRVRRFPTLDRILLGRMCSLKRVNCCISNAYLVLGEVVVSTVSRCIFSFLSDD